MFCPQCGQQNSNSASVCASCGASLINPYQPGQAAPGPYRPYENVPTNLVPAILSTICCCLPFGIVAIVYAAQVGSKLAYGDVEGARRASDTAKMWCWIAFGSGLVIGLLELVGQFALRGHLHR